MASFKMLLVFSLLFIFTSDGNFIENNECGVGFDHHNCLSCIQKPSCHFVQMRNGTSYCVHESHLPFTARGSFRSVKSVVVPGAKFYCAVFNAPSFIWSWGFMGCVFAVIFLVFLAVVIPIPL